MELYLQFPAYLRGALRYYFTFTAQIESYSGADKSLARPGRKQATATVDFDDHISYL